MRLFTILLLLSVLSGCTRQQEFEIHELTIITKDAKTMADWYEKNLGFLPSNDTDLLYHDNLILLLEENKDAKHADSIKADYNLKRVPGIFKFGFATNQFENLVTSLDKNGVNFHGSVVYDSLLNMRMLVVKDPDGNRIQFFETDGMHKLKPFFMALMVENIGEQEKWYQVKWPIEETFAKDLEERKAYVRLLKSPDVVVELIQLDDRKVRSELDYSDIMGFHMVKVKGARVPFSSDHEGNKIIHAHK